MRVIAGKYKRRQLIASDDLSIRPLMDRVKEYIFNVVQDWVPEGNILDVFAGSGSFGIEALSRGASSVTFVDVNPKAIAAIERNMKHLKVDETWRIAKQDALEFLSRNTQRYDLVFCDPPYDMGSFDTFLETLGTYPLLEDDGMLIIEHYSKNQLPPSFGNYELYRDKKFGKTLISMYRMKEDE